MTWQELSKDMQDALIALALQSYSVKTVEELEATFVNKGYENIAESYLADIKVRYQRAKVDVAKAYVPTDEEYIEKLEAKIHVVAEPMEL